MSITTPIHANILDVIAAHTAKFGRWDPDGVRKIIERQNTLIEHQITFTQDPTTLDFERAPQQKRKKSYERTPEEIATELIVAANGAIAEKAHDRPEKIVSVLKTQKEMNNKFIANMAILTTDYHLQVKVVKHLRSIAEINDKLIAQLERKQRFSSFRNLFRKGKRGTLKSRIMLALGFSKKEIVSMLKHTEPSFEESQQETEDRAQEMVLKAQEA